jgi:hypothetical protein
MRSRTLTPLSQERIQPLRMGVFRKKKLSLRLLDIGKLYKETFKCILEPSARADQ